jgi:hypothetical protein
MAADPIKSMNLSISHAHAIDILLLYFEAEHACYSI